MLYGLFFSVSLLIYTCIWNIYIEFVPCFQIIALLNDVEALSALAESKIEGVEPFGTRFQQIVGSIKKMSNDVLDHRKLEFDDNFEDFRRQLREVEASIK